MKSTRMIVLLTGLFVAIGGQGARAAESAEEIKHIAIQTLASWNIAFNHGGLDDYGDLYAEDAVLLTPAGEFKSDKGIQEFWKTVYQVGINSQALDVTAVQGDGDQIVVTSRWEALRSPENDVVFEGRMVNVLEKQSDGQWKTIYQRWN